LLIKYNIPTSLKTIAIPELYGSIRRIQEFASSIEKKITLTKYISPVPNCWSDFNRIAAKDIYELAQTFDNANDIMAGVTSRDGNCDIASCNAGKGRFAINPYGEMMGCICYPEIKIPIENDSCKDVLRVLREKLNLKNEICEDCKNCSYKETCGKCGGLNYMETGSTTKCSQYRKELAKYKLI